MDLMHKRKVLIFFVSLISILRTLSAIMTEKIKKTIDFISIILVFALTGSSTAILSGVIMNAFGAQPWTFKYIVGYLLFIFPLYQALTLIYAAIFGKFNWFFSRQKKIVGHIRKFSKKVFVPETE
ncbi:MAG: hypothetical protein CVV23_07475 [Ignavibacteriae bacterium HGW-Ignavibacteriae-2]|nr:MAG: hypothetical protein CVV23_07475 [Ignavibacteriae bacterium HGW-Ignavibacteriae-2]